jgi:hypothetical protein
MHLLRNNPDIKANEKNYADNIILPLMEGITDSCGGDYSYEHREAFLSSMNTILKQRGLIKKNSEGYKADGIITFK